MALQHHDFELRLRDAERLRLFVQSTLFDQETLDASLKEAQLSSQYWELEAKEAMERAVWAEAERDVARHEATMARLEIEAMSDARALVEGELAVVRRVSAVVEDARLKEDSQRDAAQQALVAAEEARPKAEEENGRLTDERLSLLMELGATKDNLAAFRETNCAEKTTIEAEFDARSDVIFNYGTDPSRDARHIDSFDSRIFCKPSMPPKFFICPSRCWPIKTIGKDLSAKSLPTAGDGVEIPPGPPARSDKEPNVAAEG